MVEGASGQGFALTRPQPEAYPDCRRRECGSARALDAWRATLIDDEAENRDAGSRRVVRAWLVAAGWRIEGQEVLLEVSLEQRRVLRVRPVPGGIAVYSKRGTLLWTLRPRSSDSSASPLPPDVLALLVRPVSAQACRPPPGGEPDASPG